MNPKISEILMFLPDKDQKLFLNELIVLLKKAAGNKNFSAIDDCISSWEEIAELNSIPRFKENAVKRFKMLQKAGKIHA